MNQEIEAKIKVAKLVSTEALLKELGAIFMHDVHQVDTYFMDTHRLLHKKDCGLRIRQQVISGIRSALITYKGARTEGKYKTRPEFETGIDNVKMMENIFEALGYYSRLVVEKKRSMWKLDDCEVCLDELVELGFFIEVEGPNETAVESVLNKLNLQNEPHVPESYASMCEQVLKLE